MQRDEILHQLQLFEMSLNVSTLHFRFDDKEVLRYSLLVC